MKTPTKKSCTTPIARSRIAHCQPACGANHFPEQISLSLSQDNHCLCTCCSSSYSRPATWTLFANPNVGQRSGLRPSPLLSKVYLTLIRARHISTKLLTGKQESISESSRSFSRKSYVPVTTATKGRKKSELLVTLYEFPASSLRAEAANELDKRTTTTSRQSDGAR